MPQDVFRKIYLTFLLVVAVQPVATSDELILSFEAETTTYIGPELLSPFNPTGYIGSLALANPDLIKLDGQFIVKNFDSRLPGTQTYRLRKEGGSDDGVEMFLHNPLFFRLEAFTTRIGDNSPTGYPENTKILLPRREESETTSEEGVRTAGFFGDATLTVVDGVPESFSYYMGPDSLSSFDYRTVPNRGVSLDELTIQGGSIHLLESFDLGTTAAADVPYGFYSTLEGNPAETVLKTTRGIIQAELDDNNLLTGRQSQGGVPIDFDPLDGKGTLFHYELIDVEATLRAESVPEPASNCLILIGAMMVFFIQRKNRRR